MKELMKLKSQVPTQGKELGWCDSPFSREMNRRMAPRGRAMS